MESVDVVRMCYRAALRGDDDVVVGLLADGATWNAGPELGGLYAGIDEIAQRFDAIDRDWRDWLVQDEMYLSGGDTVVVRGVWWGTYRATGRSVAARFVHVWIVRDGRIASFEQSIDGAALRDAMASAAA
jgi:ketosteroid isomerase-like protein